MQVWGYNCQSSSAPVASSLAHRHRALVYGTGTVVKHKPVREFDLSGADVARGQPHSLGLVSLDPVARGAVTPGD